MTRTKTDDVENRLVRLIAEGNYRSFDDALAALKTIVTDQNVLEKVHSAWVHREIAKGDEGGGEIPAEEVFAEARARVKGKR